MTKTEVTVTEVRTIYVAFDGKEFPTEQDCKSYESAFLEEKAKEIAEKLPHFTFTPDWTDPDVEWDWYFISSTEELNAVRNYLYFDDASAWAWEFEPTAYPCWLAFSLENGGYGDNGFNLNLKPGYTALVGPNGAGKTTLLSQIRNYAGKKNYIVLDYSNLTDGGNHARQWYLENDNIELLAASACSSEGENISLHFSQFVKKIGNAARKSAEGNIPLVVLLDSLDSGASIDRLREMREFFDFMLKDKRGEAETYIINAVNSYELARDADCVDVRTGKHLSFKDYDEYAHFVCSYFSKR